MREKISRTSRLSASACRSGARKSFESGVMAALDRTQSAIFSRCDSMRKDQARPSGQRAPRENAAREVRLLLQHVVARTPEKQGKGAGSRPTQHVVAIRVVRTEIKIGPLRDMT